MNYSIHAFNAGTFFVPGPEVYWMQHWNQREEMNVIVYLNILRSQGLGPEDISKVIVTPLQAYATANIHLLRNAEICISRKGWIEDFQAPYYHLHVPRHLRIPPDVNHYLQNEGWEKVRLLQDEEEILPGIRVFWAGVHHRSSLAVCIETGHGTVILTDCFFKYRNIEQGLYLGVMESMMEADATWSRIRKEAKIVASIYDPEVFRRFPRGVVA